MALTRPTLILTPAFDATLSHTFTFAIYDTTQRIVANKLVIRDQESNTVVYEQKKETFKYEHVVDGGTLTNGKYYNAVISVFDAEGNESPTSIPIQFYCYTTPVLQFTNLPSSNLITNASYDFTFSYNQAEGEKISSYIVNLYNSSKTLISSSNTIYAQDGTPPFNGHYLFAGFENSTNYFVEIVATTINGTIVSTDLEEILVQYERPDIFTLLELSNNCDEGYITIRSNIILIEGESNPDPPKYIDDKEIDLTQDGSWAKWDEGYSISGDMTLRLWFRNPTPYSEILQFSNISGQRISIRYMEGYENVNAQEQQSYIAVYVDSSLIEGLSYYIYSNYIPILPDTDKYYLQLTRQNNIYKIRLLKA